jgi:hypothetical protein
LYKKFSLFNLLNKIYIYRRIIGSIISLIIFMILLFATIIGLPIILTKVKRKFYRFICNSILNNLFCFIHIEEPICPPTTMDLPRFPISNCKEYQSNYE